MAVTKNHSSEMIQELYHSLSSQVFNNSLINCPDYIRQNKLLASLYMDQKDDNNAIFHLTESHAAFLRQKVINTFHHIKSKSNHEVKFSGSLLSELDCDYVSFDNVYFRNGFAGVIERLKEMPKEWTIVQLTFQADLNETFFGSFKNQTPDILPIHLTRLSCGTLIDERVPFTVVIQPPPDGRDDGFSSMLEVVRECIKKITLPGTKKQKFQKRQEGSNDLKSIVTREIVTELIKEWRCLMIGTLCDFALQHFVKLTVDGILSTLSKEERSKISRKELSILYQIADGSAHLSENEIFKAVNYCTDSDNVCTAIVSGICGFKEASSHRLITAKRNPVLLVLDDNLELIPWETLPILFKHPVSRVPSLHLAHALYNKHKDDIIYGNRIVKNTDVAFYIINPESDLALTEKNLLKFIQQRYPNWNGIKGEKPSEEIFLKSLLDYNVFVYSGHGNGAQYLKPQDVCELNVNVVPFLFGCSSATKKVIGDGGRNELMGVSDQFLIAGCPCLIGMLWPVTTTDTDLVTMLLLNMTMSGNAININDIIGSDEIAADEAIRKEPELLRALKSARSAAKLFINGAALVARGIPVEFQD